MAERSSQKTEKPTSRRLKEARRRGQVANSRDLSTAVSFAVLALVLGLRLPECARRLGSFVLRSLERTADTEAITSTEVLDAVAEASIVGVELLAPVLAAGLVAGILVSAVQSGGVGSIDPIIPKLERVDPFNGARRLVGRRSVAEGIKLLFKLCLVGFVACASAVSYFVPMSRSAAENPDTAFLVASLAIRDCVVGSALALLLVGAGDRFLQRWLHSWDLRMTKDEVRRDHKVEDGDPLVRGWRRRVHGEVSFQQMLSATRNATVVIANPVHIAVALRYAECDDGAPRVVAKGIESIARVIRSTAESAGVRVVFNRPLARALLRVDVGAEIPVSLFIATAEVLAWISQLESRESTDQVPGAGSIDTTQAV